MQGTPIENQEGAQIV